MDQIAKDHPEANFEMTIETLSDNARKVFRKEKKITY